jgi:PAS domain S-box-containing protein
MNLSSSRGASGAYTLTVLWEDGERVICRGWHDDGDGDRVAVLAVRSSSEHPTPGLVDRLTHEYELKDELDARSAVRPLALVREHGRTVLVLEDPGGQPLAKLLRQPLEIGRFLRVATGLSAALRQFHQGGLIHKDIKPSNVLVEVASGRVWLTGFGIASRLPRERQSPEPPELIGGTLAYMAPEQTGRMNRSIDSRSDLYSLGVTLYEALTGTLPFMASDPMEWVHCHIARQPVPPAERRKDAPVPLSAIVSKLLAKTADERYQTAAGVESDLRRCLAQWDLEGRIDAFAIGEHDASDRLLIPEKLYGRAREIDALLAAFHRVAAGSGPELVLVSGYAGIGKSSLVSELHKVLVPPRGIFAAGKFDQSKRDIPYATLAQAFQQLIRRLLAQSEAELQRWRDCLQQALDPNAALIVDLIPELKLVIGAQPPVADLPPRDAQNRLQLVFRRFIEVFARPEHPLALFLDDLQWLDGATLDLLEHLVTHSDVRHLLLVGAYRDNEVNPSHPLMRTLDAIRESGARVQDMMLSPLGLDDVGQLVADAMRCEPERVQPLAQLVQEKTGGNPFFAIQFFITLAEEGLLAFDPIARGWQWDINRIRAKSYTDNVVDLMVEKLKRFSSTTQDALKQLACLGNAAPTSTLALVHGTTGQGMLAALWEAVHTGLVFHQESTFSFLHDRIQQAAYSLIPDGDRAEVHLRIGRALLASMTADGLAEHPFDVANQFNRGATRLIDRDEKAQVATINLGAGRKAKASAAYASSRAYFSAGMALLDETDWHGQYELTFSLWLERAESELLSSDFDRAEQLIMGLLRRGTSNIDLAAVYRLKVQFHVMRSENPQAVASALACLRLFGIDLPAHPTREQVQAEYESAWRTLDGRPIESLIDLPVMTDPNLRAAMQVLSVVTPAARYTDFHLWCLLACHMVTLSMQHGMTGPSAHGFGYWGSMLGPVFHRYQDGHRCAKLACDLVEKHGFLAYQAKVYHAMGLVAFWTDPISTAIDFMQASSRTATEMGDQTFAVYGMLQSVTGLLLRNDPLDAAWRESERSLDFARKAKFRDIADVVVAQQRFIATMQGRTASFSTFSDAQFDEAVFEAQLTGNQTAAMVCLYWIAKLKTRLLSGDYAEALAAADKAKALLWGVTVWIQLVDYYYYTALTVAALYRYASADEQQRWRELLTAHGEQLREWAGNYPPTFGDKHALVSAEIARIEGRELDAERLYEQAILSARENGFVQNEGLALEVAARFYTARGFQTIADAYFRNARYCYLRWGADGKVRQLDRLHPHLAAAEGNRPTATIGPPIQQLDVASVVKATQAVSSEIVLPKLIERLMTIALENAGADRGLLILPSADDHLIHAEAQATGDQVRVVLCQSPIRGIACPETLIRYVIRTHESVILDDASKPSLFSEDDYLRGRRAKSILCLPLIKQGRLTGMIYLENTLTSYAFPPARIAVLELLAAQAAISLENTRLYSDLRESEAKLEEAQRIAHVGYWQRDLATNVLTWSGESFRIVGLAPEESRVALPRYLELIHPEDRASVVAGAADALSGGHCYDLEYRVVRPNGEVRVVHSQGNVMRDESGTPCRIFGTIQDITERKRAEEDLRESERRYREAQMALVHANRVTTMGQLTASIAHEVNQPIAAAVTNAHAALRWLGGHPPDLEEVRQSLDAIIKDGNRAGDVIDRIRDLVKKAPPRHDQLDINEGILEVIEVTRSELLRNGVSLQTQLAKGLPPIRGDRIQLQQTVLNLIMNAVEAMSEAREGSRDLRISTAEDLKGVLVAVRDSGPGLNPESLKRLFDPFYTTKPGGMGMGLSICRSIIEAHGGRLWASANEPRGAVFQFTLPPERDETVSAEHASQMPAVPSRISRPG